VKLIHSLFALALALLFSVSAFADDLTGLTDPERSGFSSLRLGRVASWYQARVDGLTASDPTMPGAVVAIAKDGKLAYLAAIGFQDRAKTIPMKTESIFWIASMTKPITSVAAMILVDDGKLELHAPVSRYLPELKDMQVAHEVTDATPVDPVFTAIERPKAAWDALGATLAAVDEVVAKQRGREITGVDRDANRQADAALGAARDEFVATIPTTMAGLRAALEYAVEIDRPNVPQVGGRIAPALLKLPVFA
jgi:hypothetical protein